METESRINTAIPTIRRAQRDDALAVAELMTALGYPALAAQVEGRIAVCKNSTDTAILVAECEGRVVGVLSFHCIPLFHSDGFLGRITSLIVAPEHRKMGLGRLLISAAEEFARAHGCNRIEVTSGDHRADAHAFYEHLGYRTDCRRFIKTTPGASS